ncbi:hypothetical protein JEU11_13640 [Paraglaciecola chathamensis]|uniref:Uncharacterized protein n=1 Tax=Paraglaciecola chathamensis TaxID=368405 RepID=A0ABS0WGC6_9ALTE|nr:hypothetical protein [Paraglaciecola chathamensis]MBJ2137498.1 hypothetical protein [Paraglaciecola chathamensis]MDO6558916.1 hypothetical protein [Paraglaciecola chathamensis]MDO6841349.1 hypothetical protein [Paraglaciecola chathamensis]
MSQSQLVLNIQRALKLNFVPAVCLQVIALGIGLSFFYWPASQPVFNFFAELKAQYGVGYAIASTALFGGLLPYLYLLLSGQVHFKPLRQLLFYCVLWAAMGWLVDEFYSLQITLFGSDTDVTTLIKKMAFDQFVFSALLTCPLLTLCYHYKDAQFNLKSTIMSLDKRLFLLYLPTTIITNWLVWIPSVFLIYLMPPMLQIPLFNLVLCFFVLVLAILNTDSSPVSEPLNGQT